MKLLDSLNKLNINKIDDLIYLDIDGFNFYYTILKNKKEALGINLSKALINKNDLKLLNNKFKNKAYFISDNLVLKRDVIFIYILDDSDLNKLLVDIAKYLHYLNYYQRETCVMCGAKAESHVVNKVLIPIHDKCIDRFKIDINKFNKSSKSKFINIMFGILGSVIGILPSLIISLIIRNYSIISSILLFISPCLGIIFYNLKNEVRETKDDIISLIISFIFVFIYHIILAILCVIEFDIVSINNYFEVLKNFFIESMVETTFMFIVGYLSGYFLIKKKAFHRLSKI